MNDKRLIEDYLPIQAISAEASREKSVRKGHISTLHLWWARRPLVACRAAVYGALVPASRFIPENGPDNKKQSLGRANAAKFVERLCKYPGDSRVISDAQRHILEAHAERLTEELKEAKPGSRPAWVEESKFKGERVTVEDIEAGRAPRPRVLDMFAGGGAIPLEALRLGCEAYALDLNPVAHIVELCTLVYPQKYGQPDLNARGMTGPKNEKGETTWGGFAKEVNYWGKSALKRAKAEIGSLYPLIPDPQFQGKRLERAAQLFQTGDESEVPPGYLLPSAYLWTRTAKCKNPACRATVPLAGLTWLCRKEGHFAALKMIPDEPEKAVRFEVTESSSVKGLGFDPAGYGAGCPFCGTAVDIDYVKAESRAKRMGLQMMAAVCTRPVKQGKVFLSSNGAVDSDAVEKRLAELGQQAGLKPPGEGMDTKDSTTVAGRGFGITNWSELFTRRQLLSLLTLAKAARETEKQLREIPLKDEHVKAILTGLALLVDRVAEYGNNLTRWISQTQAVAGAFGRQALPMVWDFPEVAPFGSGSGNAFSMLEAVCNGLEAAIASGSPACISRGSATSLPWTNEKFDAVITDPPYYDNVEYAILSDFFYVWLKRTVGHLYPEHFASDVTPKKNEAVANAVRYGGSKEKAMRAYETMMAEAFSESHRVLKPGGELVVVYAHKTTLGWATLVDSLRRAGFTVTEAWPLDTERPGRLISLETAALASSIFLVARKREVQQRGQYETEVRPELEQIVRERVATFWEMGVSGADLVIACVGAGLRAFTRFEWVEYANGEPVPAERFLSEVETVVLDQILSRLSKEVGGSGDRQSLAGVDAATRFYILWRYTFRTAELDAGEAIIFANGTHVELDGHGSLTQGTRALVEKKKGKYRLRDFRERGDDEKLGVPAEDGTPPPLVDALHRMLWLLRNRPAMLADYLRDSGVNREQLRLVAQALAGPALKGGELSDISPASELSALAELTANWRSVVEDATLTPTEREERRTGQKTIEFDKERSHG